MIQSIDNRELQMYKSTSTKQSDPVKATEKSTSADAAVAQSVSSQSKTDRVEISTQGRAALAQSAVLSGEQAPPATNASTDASATADVSATAQAAQVAAQKLAENTTASETTNLSSLTEQQIKAMVSEGTVTQAEAQAELAKRQATTQPANTASQQQQAVKQYSSLQQTQNATILSSVA